MLIYSKNIKKTKKNPAKWHPDPIWNDGALGFFWKPQPQQEQEQDQQDE